MKENTGMNNMSSEMIVKDTVKGDFIYDLKFCNVKMSDANAVNKIISFLKQEYKTAFVCEQAWKGKYEDSTSIEISNREQVAKALLEVLNN